MNVYDFDGTIYNGDSSRDFYFYCLTRQPGLIRLVPRQACAVAGYLLSQARSIRKPQHERSDKTEFKESFYSYLPYVRDLPDMLASFWKANFSKIQPWYLLQKRGDDVIISASPVFLLDDVCKRLGVRLIASQVDPRTGKCVSPNCGGKYKPLRFREVFHSDTIDAFYSDSNSDLPMAREALRAYKVRGGRVYDWDT